MLRILLLIVILKASLLLSAQPKNSFDFSFNHQALSVKNVDSAATFYKYILGLEEITNRTQMAGIRWFSLSEGKELHLVSVITEPVTINKAVHLALTTSKFDSFIEYLKKGKITFSDWPGKLNTVTLRADGIKQIYLQDTDGYWIEINSVSEK